MKKLMMGVVLLAFLFAAMPAHALDHNPYITPRASDKPTGDDDPWEDLKKAEPRDDGNQATEDEAKLNLDKKSSLIEYIMKLFPNGQEKKQDAKKSDRKARSSKLNRCK